MPRFLVPTLTAFGLILIAAGASAQSVVHPDHPEDHGDDPHKVDFAHSSCAQCHACEHPTSEDPCLVACPRHGHFQGEHEAGEGPDVVIIDQLANLYEPVVFAHKLHASMSEMSGGCTHCHHYSEESGEIPPCRSCHEEHRQDADLSMPALKGAYHRQCMNCHRDWSHDNACAFCHEQANGDPEAAAHDPTDIVGVPHPMIEAPETYTYETTYEEGPTVTFHHADHVEVFGQDCVDCHRGDSCASCHDTDPEAQVSSIKHLTSCCTCHEERDCGFCHGHEPTPRFDHAQSTGFDLAPYHVKNDCQACHSTPDHFRHPSGDCKGCHIHWEVGSFDHAVTGLVLNDDHVEIDCEMCHIDEDFTQTPSCEECHDEPMLPRQLPGIRRR